ncbi:MAG: hypothetical protein JWN41_1537, partial [Thermoleophilia bacterium]|nr:hypothetical protein [Thermoleophilia bacterium]
MELPSTLAVKIAMLALIASMLGGAVMLLDQHRTSGVQRSPAATRQQLDAALATAAERPAQRAAATGSNGATTSNAATPVTTAAAPATGSLVANATSAPAPLASTPVPAPPSAAVQRRGGVDCASPHQVVRMRASEPMYVRPNGL